jgi:hypothetical protein
MIAFIFWASLGAFPLASQLDSLDALGLVLSEIQVGIAVTALLWIHRRSRFGHWFLHLDDLPGPAFRFSHTLRFAAGTLLLAPPLLLAFFTFAFVEQVETMTGGYISFDSTGIHSVTREYRKSDHEIHLVGMMHIGEDEAYRQMFRSFAGESTLILAEGVRDETGLLGNTEGGLYDVVAGEVGLSVQPSFEHLRDTLSRSGSDPPWPDIRNADVDAAIFSEETIELLNAASVIYRGGNIRQAAEDFQERYGDRGTEVAEILMQDLIDRRNAVLLDEISGELSAYQRIVVPWGALHLPGIEKTILSWGFSPVGSSRRRLASYATIFAVLLAD